MNTLTHSNKSLLNKKHDIIVFSHLRWEFVTQRPQHIMNRFATNRTVLFVEDPIGRQVDGESNFFSPSKNVHVLQPESQSLAMADLAPIVQRYVKRLNIKNPILWFYSPMVSDFAKILPHSLVVYDCMDELSLFKGAPQDLIDKERELITLADVVFTGGRSLYESKKKLSDSVYCFPSSVDKAHFAKAAKETTRIPHDIAGIPKPIVGFYGVIDERIDISLLKQVALLMPDVAFAMIGPVVKIDPATLPKLPNIHYLGQKSYDVLPNYLKSIDIAMMPFALNESTRFISPTKTLEFMAATKPIISTPITDVVKTFSREVTVVSSVKEFVYSVRYYLKEPLFAKLRRAFLQTHMVQKTSWDATVGEMSAIIQTALVQKAQAPMTKPSLGRVLGRLQYER